MTREEALRLACEEVGATYLPHDAKSEQGPAWVFGNPFNDEESWWLHPEHPALPAYAAELLHAKALKEGRGHFIMSPACTLYRNLDPRGGLGEDCLYAWFMLPPDDHILAVLVALGKLTLEEAQGVAS